MRAHSVAACLKDQIPVDIPCHYARVQGSTLKAADCVDRTERMQLQQLCEGVDENSAALACEGVDENSRVWTKTRGNSFLFLKEQLKVIIIRQLHWSVPATN